MSQTKKRYTTNELISEFDKMDRQIIHGSDIFGQAAGRLRALKECLTKEESEREEAEEALREIYMLCGNGDPSDGEGTSPAEVVQGLQNFIADGKWTKELPTESGSYWHWNGDQDANPIHLEIMWSGHTNSCFAPAGQWGWTEAQNVEDMGGFWMRLNTPTPPHDDLLVVKG